MGQLKKILIPYTKKIEGDIETPITLFQKLVGNEKGFLLETKDVKQGRYSFIGRKPYGSILSYGNRVEIFDGEKRSVKDGSVLDKIRNYFSQFKVKNTSGIPMIGGAVGTIAYDVIRQYEKLEEVNVDRLKTPDAELMLVDEFVVYDHFYSEIQIVVLKEDNEFGKKEAEIAIESIEKKIHNTGFEAIKQTVGKCENKNYAKSNTSKEQFMDMVKKAKNYIYEGDIFQVVLSQRWSIDTEENPFIIYRRLRRLNPSPYLYYFNFGDYQIVGSSPEMLVELKKSKVLTCPIAGTRKRGVNPEEDRILAEDLASDEKEIAEHTMLVDLARNDMGRIAKIGTVEVEEFMKVKNFSHVMHLVSLVGGELSPGYDQFNLLSSFLPAGTLSGAPKIRAMEIIDELEKEKRGFYGGSIGYFGMDGNMDMCITIRTMLIKGGTAYLQAGAGIVADSNPELEYEETRNKINALVKVVGRLEG
ncbi:anthranilate synthase component I [Clostridium sediminicola]|uniref:anthranilate synthase component I n=1 Tax=Clostridium sediminicola TaxID=3114879 RepID=UPI0031F25E4E